MAKKVILFVFILLVLAGITLFFCWQGKSRLAAHYLSRQLHAPASMESLEIRANQIDISRLWIGMPRHFRSKTSFSAGQTEVDMRVRSVFANPLVIDRVALSDIFIGIEYRADGTTNWDTMLSSKAGKTSGKDYLIRTLVLENLTVEVMQANGQKKRFPTIARMEFHNISSETGFPVQEIEKAIFNLIMQDIFNKFNLFKQIPNTPMKYLPNLFK